MGDVSELVSKIRSLIDSKFPAHRFSRQSVFQIIDQLHSLIQALSHSEMIILGKRYDHEFEIEQLTIRAVENRTVENPSS